MLSRTGFLQYESLVTTKIAVVDPSRIIWPHSPAQDGWASGIDRLTTRPKPGQPLIAGAKPAGVGRPVNFSFAMEGQGPYVTADYPGNQSTFVETVLPVQGRIEGVARRLLSGAPAPVFIC